MSIYTKKISVGAFLKKGEDFKDKDIVEIASEGKQVEGQFGIQNLFLIKTSSGKEGNVSFNTTSINCLIDTYGEDSKNWIGKKAKVWAILSNVQGKMIKVYYFTSPDADIDDGGEFIAPKSPSTENKPSVGVNASITPSNPLQSSNSGQVLPKNGIPTPPIYPETPVCDDMEHSEVLLSEIPF